MAEQHFSGVFSLLLTPFLKDKSIDWPAYERYLDWQLEMEPNGLFAVCGSSEMKWLTLDERLELARLAAKRTGSIPVVATANLQPDLSFHSVEVGRMADTGVAGVVLVPPPGVGVDQGRLGDYFAGVIDASPIPTLIYEWPMVSPYFVDAAVYGKLVRDHGLAGIKDTTCTMEGIGKKIELTGSATVFQANAPFFLESIHRGANGIMAIVTTAAADLAIDFWNQAKKGSPRAEELHEALVLLDCALIRGGAYPATGKHLAVLRGLDMEITCRAPGVPVPEVLEAVRVWHSHAMRTGALRTASHA